MMDFELWGPDTRKVALDQAPLAHSKVVCTQATLSHLKLLYYESTANSFSNVAYAVLKTNDDNNFNLGNISMAKTNILNTLDEAIFQQLLENSGFENLTDEEIQNKHKELFRLSRNECVSSSIESYQKNAPELLAEDRQLESDFREHNFLKWKPAFDHLEILSVIAQNLGEAQGYDVKERNEEDNNATMAALAHIFPRALLVVREIICLLKGGFPDGALARWRSLHELSVTAMYIQKHGDTSAKSYLLSFHFMARNSAKQVNDHAENNGLKPISELEMKGFNDRCDEAEAVLGRKPKNEKVGEWPKINTVHKDFTAIEKDVEMDHWRPYYKWATGNTHAHHRPADTYLGMAGSESYSNLVGPSDSGFVDPFQLTAISLSQLVKTYLMHSPNLSRLVHIEVFETLASQMSEIAAEIDQTT